MLNYAIIVGAAFITGSIVGYVVYRRRGAQRKEPQPTVGVNYPDHSETSLVDILKSLSQTHRSIHDERIKRELHIVIATLAFYAAAASLKFSGKLPSDQSFRWIVWAGFSLLAIAAFIYLWCSAAANRINQGLAERVENTMIALLKRAGINNFERPAAHPARLRWIWEALIIIIGAALSAFVITYL